jgi:hypothetical protein
MIRHVALVASAALVLSTACLAGCEDTPPPNTQAAAAPEREISRDQAIWTARGDAAMSLRIVDLTGMNVSRSGAFWVIDLYGQRGQGVRYAIAAADGTIRERRLTQ